MMFKHASAGESASVAPICRAEAQIFAWDKGTILGRAVVPDVCSTSAISPASAAPGCAAFAGVPPSRVKLPARSPGTNSSTATPSFAATSRASVATPFCTTSALAFRSVR